MRRMSFLLTKAQVRNHDKDVTRRVGWVNLKAGEFLAAVNKCQGLKRGESAELLAVIEVVSVRRERLDDLVDPARPEYGREEMRREGFPGMDPQDFLLMPHWTIDPDGLVTRIEFRYVG